MSRHIFCDVGIFCDVNEDTSSLNLTSAVLGRRVLETACVQNLVSSSRELASHVASRKWCEKGINFAQKDTGRGFYVFLFTVL